MAGPLGAITPRPGVSYLFSPTGGSATTNTAVGGGLGGGAAPGVSGIAGGMVGGGGGGSGLDEFAFAIPGSSLWGIAQGGGPASASGLGNANPYGTLPPGSAWTPAIGEMVVKIDGKLKVCVTIRVCRLGVRGKLKEFCGNFLQKIISTLLKELDQFARNAIKDELATLDPLLRNLAVQEDGREQFDFEGAV
jgi:hypothetical protein